MQVRKDKYKDNPILAEGLDLVEEDDQITHQIELEEELQVQEGLSECCLCIWSPQCFDLISVSRHLQGRSELCRERGEVQVYQDRDLG
jgi:hypothetical protein